MKKEFDIHDYFNNIFTDQTIFRQRDVLRPTYVPKLLFHRDDQIKKIAQIVGYALTNSTPSNILIYGKTGTGKTEVIRYVKRALNENSRKRGMSEPNWIYANCQQVNTTYRVLAHIYNSIIKRLQQQDSSLLLDKIPFTGLPTDEVYKKLLHLLDTHLGRTVVFVVLDEIDLLARKNGDETLYLLSRINEQLASARVSLVGISNVLDFKTFLDGRVLSSLSEEEIVFPAYNSTQLKDILMDRVNAAFQEGACPEVVVSLCAALAAKEDGDARKALDLLRRAGDIAECQKAEVIKEAHVFRAQKQRTTDKTKEFLDKLPFQMKLVLLALYCLDAHQLNVVKTGDLYFTYKELARLIPGVSHLTHRRVSDLINELNTNGIISAHLVSRGRGGRSKKISLEVRPEMCAQAFKRETRLAQYMRYVPQLARKRGLVLVSGDQNPGFYKPLL